MMKAYVSTNETSVLGRVCKNSKSPSELSDNCRKKPSSSYCTKKDWNNMAAEKLDERIVALEKGATFQATQDAIRKREEEFLVTLRGIREAMTKEKQSNASSAEVDSLRQENTKLKATVAKQEYRIQHLVSGMEKLLEEKKSSA